MHFAENVRFLRKKFGLSQDDLAEKLAYKSYTTIQKWETGISEPSLSTAMNVADLFHVDIDSLARKNLSKQSADENKVIEYQQRYQNLNNDNQQTVNNLIDDLSEKQERLDALIQQLKEEQSGQTLIAASTGKNKIHQEVTDPEKLKHIEELSEKARKSPDAKITD